jgi:hypothetical protein
MRKISQCKSKQKINVAILEGGIATGRQSTEWQKYFKTDYAKQTQTQYE